MTTQTREEPSREDIYQLFDSISSTYDFANKVLSFGIDRYWRKKVPAYAPPREDLILLDCATGTGDLLLQFMKKPTRMGKAIGIDLSEKLLKIAERKSAKHPYRHNIEWERADMHDLPFADCQFDCVTISFGIRNAREPLQALQEMHRVLNQGGRALVLEFSIPEPAFFRKIYLTYLRRLLPYLGGLIARNKKAYAYLNQTIETFPHGEEFCKMMRHAGFSSVERKALSWGIVNLYIGTKG